MNCVISIDQALFQIPIVHYDWNRTIKFQLVRKRGRPNFLTGDNLRCCAVQNFQTVTAIKAFRHVLSHSYLLYFLYRCATVSFA